MSEIPVEPEDREERVRRRGGETEQPLQAASDWEHEEPSDRRLSFGTRLRLVLYLLGLSKGRRR